MRSKSKKHILYIFILFLFFDLAFSNDKKQGEVSIKQYINYNQITPGSGFSVYLKFNIQKDWHIYWKNAGNAGLPTEFNWILPNNINLVNSQWEIPDIFPFADFANIGYDNTPGFIFNFKTDKDLKPGKYQLKCHISWLICREGCYKGGDTISFSLFVDNKQKSNPAWNNITRLLFKLIIST